MAVVFVHGWTGDALNTWRASPSLWRRILSPIKKPPASVDLVGLLDQYLPKLEYDYYSFRHEAGISRIEIEQVADLLLAFLNLHVPAHLPVVLVAHSLGGLACRLAILQLLSLSPTERTHRFAGLLLYGTPNSGTQLARLAGRFSSSAKQMAPLGDFLYDLNRGWAERVLNGGRPELDPDDRAELLCWNAVGVFDRVVPPGSAAGLAHLGAVYQLPKTHVGLPKARSNRDSSFLLLVKFLAAAEASIRDRPRIEACARLLYEQRRGVLAKDWVEEEEESFELSRTEDPRRLTCRIRQKRCGGRAQRTFRFAAQVEKLAGPPEEVDFLCQIGRGLLSDPDLGRVVQDLDSAGNFLQVAHLRVKQGKRSFEYFHAPEEDRRGIGWVLWVWRAPEDLKDGEPYELLEFELTTVIDRHAGWYHYDAIRTVSRRLTVELCAPFRLNCHQRLRRGALRSDIPRGDTWISQVVADGPIASGSDVYWFFAPDAEAKPETVLGDEIRTRKGAP